MERNKTSKPGDPVTAIQYGVLAVLCEFIDSEGYPPTRQELGDILDIGVNAVSCHLYALVKKGCVEIVPKVSRGLRVIERNPDVIVQRIQSNRSNGKRNKRPMGKRS